MDNRVAMLPPGGKGTPTRFLPQHVDQQKAKGWTVVKDKPAAPAPKKETK